MGDRRYDPALSAVKRASDRAAALRSLADVEVVSALAASVRDGDAYLANVLATEAHNRILRLRAVTDSMRDGVFVADRDGTPLYVNPAMASMFGCDVDELLHGAPPIHVGPEDEKRYRAAVGKAIAQDGVVQLEYEMRRADGSPLWTEHGIAPLHDVGGRTVGYVGIVRDVTESRDHRERLRRKAAILDAIFATTHDPIAVADGDLRIVRASAAFAHRVGRAVESLIGAPLRGVVPEGDEAWDERPLPGLDGRATGVLLIPREDGG